MKKTFKKLIISPHVDDDVLGCGGILDKNTYVLYCGLNESDIPNRPSLQQRVLEADKVAKFCGHTYHILENKVNHYTIPDLIGDFEKYINKIKPTEIYIPHPSYNQDHRVSYEAALTALRPHDKNFFVKKVLVYEQPHVFLWDYSHDINASFKPNYFIPIDIERKITAYELMETQVRNFRSPKMLRSLAHLRGGQSNHDYAEAFQLIRWSN
jgi:LmbE family N-acetylglucosaminyl deacetylase